MSPSNGTNGTHNGVTSHLKKPVICVFCGASPGKTNVHLEAAKALAHIFHKQSISLIYGGGTVGIMGALASTLVSLSGPDAVHGVIPTALMKYETNYDPEHGTDASKAIDPNVFGKTTVVTDMHTRKRMMCSLVQEGGAGSGFIALSGGFGTLEELMEIVTWNQLGIHDKGVCVLNIEGYWEGILKWVRDAVEAGFISAPNGKILVEARSPEEAVRFLRDYQNSEERFKLKWGEE